MLVIFNWTRLCFLPLFIAFLVRVILCVCRKIILWCLIFTLPILWFMSLWLLSMINLERLVLDILKIYRFVYLYQNFFFWCQTLYFFPWFWLLLPHRLLIWHQSHLEVTGFIHQFSPLIFQFMNPNHIKKKILLHSHMIYTSMRETQLQEWSLSQEKLWFYYRRPSKESSFMFVCFNY